LIDDGVRLDERGIEIITEEGENGKKVISGRKIIQRGDGIRILAVEVLQKRENGEVTFCEGVTFGRGGGNMRRWMMLGLLYLVLRIRCTRIDQRTKLIN
jgi:hypothetical protein